MSEKTATNRLMASLTGFSVQRAAAGAMLSGEAIAAAQAKRAALQQAAKAAAAAKAKSANQPLGMQVKHVTDAVMEAEGHPVAVRDLRERFPEYDFEEGSELMQALRAGGRVESKAQQLVYKSEHGIRSKVDLLTYVRNQPDGVSAGDIQDAYRAVLSDAEELVREGKLLKLHNPEFGNDTFFALDARYEQRVPDDVAAEYHRIRVPMEPADLQKELRKLNMASAMASVDRKRPAGLKGEGPRKKQRRQRKVDLSKVTNVHMPELFQGAAPVNIDTK